MHSATLLRQAPARPLVSRPRLHRQRERARDPWTRNGKTWKLERLPFSDVALPRSSRMLEEERSRHSPHVHLRRRLGCLAALRDRSKGNNIKQQGSVLLDRHLTKKRELGPWMTQLLSRPITPEGGQAELLSGCQPRAAQHLAEVMEVGRRCGWRFAARTDGG